ncbi:MAG: class I SAM-dependent methyltransferase [Clostridiales bacterium]|nr:class I SAM-dependent methyltransferase [Clostridiales bacterium]
MNKRLMTIASQIENGKGFADVGTDHGYLPVHMLAAGYTGKIYASDINSAPLQTAVDSAEEAGVSDKIKFLLCDGLALCPPDEIDTIVIAGMGGDTICRILDEAEWCMDGKYKLILQPMTKPEVVRYWLTNNEFEIRSELLAEESGTIYQIIVAVFGGETRLSDAELFAGKWELTNDRQLYLRQLDKLCGRFEKAVSGIDSGETQPVWLSLFRDILSQLEEMRRKYGHGK